MSIGEEFKHYLTGIQGFDEEHHAILTIADNIRNQKTNEDIINLLNALIEILQNHFTKEEEFMISINYKFMQSHISAHSTMMSDIHHMINDVKNDKFRCPFHSIEIVNLIKYHLDWYDIPYGEFYIKNIEQTP